MNPYPVNSSAWALREKELAAQRQAERDRQAKRVADTCDTCGDPVVITTQFEGSVAEQQAWLHAFPRPSRGSHVVTVDGQYDPPQEGARS